MSEKNIVMMDKCFWINTPQEVLGKNKTKQKKKKRIKRILCETLEWDVRRFSTFFRDHIKNN